MKRPETEKVLSVATSAIGATAFSCLFVAVATDHWLYTLERRPNDANGPIDTVASHSGLWRICGQKNEMLAAFSRSVCSYINYFSKLDRDGLNPTDTILLSLRRATIFPMLSLVLSFSAQTLSLLIFCNYNPFRTTTTLVASVLFITSGLILFIGIIIYIAAVTGEATNRSRSNGEDASLTFAYRYGPSLSLAVASFFASEASGVLAIHLFVFLRRQTKPDAPPPASAQRTTATTLPPSPPGRVKAGRDGGVCGPLQAAAVLPGADPIRLEPFLPSGDPRSNPSNSSIDQSSSVKRSMADFSARYTSV